MDIFDQAEISSREHPSVTADLWKGKEGKRLIMSDGSKWELQNGKPIQVSAPTKK